MRSTIVEGMATILWGSAWASHVEEHRCCNLSGCKIEDVMPPIPDCAREQAERIAKGIEEANGCDLGELMARADEADGIPREFDGDNDRCEEFGNDLAHMADGAGVSWFDDHEEFPIEIPYDCGRATGELQMHADDTCEHKRPLRRAQRSA